VAPDSFDKNFAIADFKLTSTGDANGHAAKLRLVV
jgi:hypothetical protein